MSTEFYDGFSEKSECIARAALAAEKDLEQSKLHLLKEISKSNGNYAIIKPSGETFFMDKVSVAQKSEVEKMLKSFVDASSFIVDSENSPQNIDCDVRRDISVATADRWNVLTTLFTANGKLLILH